MRPRDIGGWLSGLYHEATGRGRLFEAVDKVLILYAYCANIILNGRRRERCQMATTVKSTGRQARLGLRATSAQEAILRKAAAVSHKSLTDFVLDAACQAAEQTLLDQRLFLVSAGQFQALSDLLERPEGGNHGLSQLFSKRAPWTKR